MLELNRNIAFRVRRELSAMFIRVKWLLENEMVLSMCFLKKFQKHLVPPCSDDIPRGRIKCYPRKFS